MWGELQTRTLGSSNALILRNKPTIPKKFGIGTNGSAGVEAEFEGMVAEWEQRVASKNRAPTRGMHIDRGPGLRSRQATSANQAPQDAYIPAGRKFLRARAEGPG